MLHRINVAVKSRIKEITTRNLNKLSNLRNKRSTYSSNINHISFISNTVYNISSYTLTEDEYNTLAFGLDYHISTRINKSIINIQLGLYFQSINRYVNDVLDNKISHLKTKLRNTCDRYNQVKLSSQFNIKDDTSKQHKLDLVYFSRCPSTDCTGSYIGETARRLSERVMDPAGRDTKLHIVRHCLNSKFLNMGYSNNTYIRRISEALFVKRYCTSLNVQHDSL